MARTHFLRQILSLMISLFSAPLGPLSEPSQIFIPATAFNFHTAPLKNTTSFHSTRVTKLTGDKREGSQAGERRHVHFHGPQARREVDDRLQPVAEGPFTLKSVQDQSGLEHELVVLGVVPENDERPGSS